MDIESKKLNVGELQHSSRLKSIVDDSNGVEDDALLDDQISTIQNLIGDFFLKCGWKSICFF